VDPSGHSCKKPQNFLSLCFWAMCSIYNLSDGKAPPKIPQKPPIEKHIPPKKLDTNSSK